MISRIKGTRINFNEKTILSDVGLRKRSEHTMAMTR